MLDRIFHDRLDVGLVGGLRHVVLRISRPDCRPLPRLAMLCAPFVAWVLSYAL
jgi:hypothetical protein